MYTDTVLAKVIKARPYLLLFRTAAGGTFEASVGAIFGRYPVYTLTVSLQIIVGTKTVRLGASCLLAFERFEVP